MSKLSSTCVVPWCTIPDGGHDDVDGHGSTFHDGRDILFGLPPEPGLIWSRGEMEDFVVRLGRYDNLGDNSDPVQETRIYLDGDGPALTADEVRAYAAWLIERAHDVDLLNQVAL